MKYMKTKTICSCAPAYIPYGIPFFSIAVIVLFTNWLYPNVLPAWAVALSWGIFWLTLIAFGAIIALVLIGFALLR